MFHSVRLENEPFRISRFNYLMALCVCFGRMDNSSALDGSQQGLLETPSSLARFSAITFPKKRSATLVWATNDVLRVKILDIAGSESEEGQS